MSEEFDSDMLMSAIELMRTNQEFKKSWLKSNFTDGSAPLEKHYEQMLSEHCNAKRNIDLHHLNIKRKRTDDIDVTTYAEYSKLFFKYRFEFFKREATKDHELYIVYWYLAEDDTEISNHVNSAISNFESFPLTFRVNPSKPYESTMEDLDNFIQNVKFFIPLLYEQLKMPENVFVTDLIRDSVGRVIDRESLSKLFKRWELYLKAYDMMEEGKLTKKEISKELLDYEYSDDSNKIHRVDEFVEEAKKLITSAVNGTFPVIS